MDKNFGKNFVDTFSGALQTDKPKENQSTALMASNQASAPNINKQKKTALQQGLLQSMTANPMQGQPQGM